MFEVIAVHCFGMPVFVFENIPTVCMLVFREVYILRIASRPKKKFVTSREREILLQQFYDDIEENEEQFLGYAFVGDEGSNSEFVQSSDGEVQADDNNEEAQKGTENILKNVPGPRDAAKYVQTLIDSFRLFFTDKMVNNIVIQQCYPLVISFDQFLKDFLMSLKPLPSILIFF